jgi:hypothetical protein
VSAVELDAMIAGLRRLEGLPALAAALAAPLVDAEAKRTAAAGTSPEGAPWAPRKKDGGRALAGAAKTIAVQALGSVVRIVLRGPEAWHQFNSYGRRIIPDGGAGIPDGVARALIEGCKQAFARAMGGA